MHRPEPAPRASDYVTHCLRCRVGRYLDVTGAGQFVDDGYLCGLCVWHLWRDPRPCPQCGGVVTSGSGYWDLNRNAPR